MPLPQPNRGFEWVQESWGPALRCTPLATISRHLFTTLALKLEGVRSESTDRWSQLAAALGVERSTLVCLRQVHGVNVADVRTSHVRTTAYESWTEADIAMTRDSNIAVTVRAADCVPLLVADSVSGAVAAVHAGWRGTAAGAALEAINALVRTYGTNPTNVMAALGPSIGPCCYTVGEELVPQFVAAHPEATNWFVRGGGLRLDLWKAIREQLLRAGLAPNRIYSCELCTFDHPELFPSYRRDGKSAGRLVAAIRPNPNS
jgi:YfiH family protein